MKRAFLTLLLPFVFAPHASAQTVFGLGVARSQVAKEPANSSAMGTVGGGFDVWFALPFWRFLVAGGDGGVYIHKDLQSRSVATTGGGRTTAVNIYHITAFGGLMTPSIALTPRRQLSASLMAGRTFIDAGANVPNCTNCPSRDLDLDGGLFLEPSVTLFLGELGITAGHRFFRDGDITSVASLRFVARLKSRSR